MTVTKIKKREGSMKQQLCLKIRHRERETDRQRQRRRKGVWQTDTDCYNIIIWRERISSGKSTENWLQRMCSKITKQEFRLQSNGRFLRNVTWRLTTKEKNSKEGKKSKKHRSNNIFFGRFECSYLNKQKFILAIFS